MKKTEFDVMMDILNKAWDSEDRESRGSPPEEVCLTDMTGNVTHRVIALVGDNDKSHGQKGYRTSYMSFIFDLSGRLLKTETYTPSNKQTFNF